MTNSTPEPQQTSESTPVELTVSAADSQVSSFRMVATLAFAATMSGLLLAGAFQITKPIIDANNAEALQKAVFKVVPNSSRLQPLVWNEKDGTLTAWSPTKKTTAGEGQGQDASEGGEEDANASTEPPAGMVIYGAYDANGVFLGYAIEAAGAGFQDTIRLLYGFNPRADDEGNPRHITGMEILESRETPGLGDRIYKDPDFALNFKNLSVDPNIIVLKKKRPKAPNQVDAITGATISSKAVVKILNDSTSTWLPRLPEPGQEPALIEHNDTNDTNDGEEGSGNG